MDVLVRENVWGDLETCQNRESQGRLNKYLASENPALKFGLEWTKKKGRGESEAETRRWTLAASDERGWIAMDHFHINFMFVDEGTFGGRKCRE